MTEDEPRIRLDLPREAESRLRASARLRSQRMTLERQFALHPWPFLCEAVYTSDPFLRGAAGGGVHKYPGVLTKDPAPGCRCTPGGCINYLHHMVNMWYKYPRTAWPKSRDMLTSWTMLALHVWLARYRDHQIVAFVSRKQGQNDDEGSAELIKRAKFICEHFPAEVQEREIVATWCRLKFPHNDSVIIGIGQGAHQLRGLSVTAWFADEFAFWEQAGETYAASLPSLRGGGRCTLVSTANPGFMKQLVLDEWRAGA